MSIDFEGRLRRRPEQTLSWGRARTLTKEQRIDKAKLEVKEFVSSIYYQNSTSLLDNKPLTESMIRLAVDPFDECIAKYQGHPISKATKRLLPTFDDWQQEKAPDLSFEDFKIILSRESDIDEATKTLFKEEYLIRNVEKYYQSASLKNYEDPMEGFVDLTAKQVVMSDSQSSQLNPLEQQHQIDLIANRLKKLRHMIFQMKKYGVDKIIDHYDRISSVKSAVLPKDVDLVINSILSEYPKINILLKDSPLETANAANLNELEKDIFFAVKEKRLKLINLAENQDRMKSTVSEEDLSQNLRIQFESAFNYLISLVPPSERNLLDQAPYYVLKLAMVLRRILPVANAEVLAQIWWQLRLGGTRARDIFEHVKKEWPDFVRQQKLEKYANHLSDNSLGSEAAGFEFKNTILIQQETKPNEVVFQIIKNLIKNHIPKNQNVIRFTLLDRDKRLKKISVPYQEGLLDSEIETNIAIALTNSGEWNDVRIDEKEKAELSYLGHNSKKRKKNSYYRTIYHGFGENKKTDADYEGDYLVQIGSIYEDSRDPRSLFAVDSHKAAIQLKFRNAGEIIMTTRYNHQYFDGSPAKSHTDYLVADTNNVTLKPKVPEILGGDDNSQENYLKDLMEQPEETELPLVEARADYDDDYLYETVSLNENDYLSSTDFRSLIIAKANNIQYFQMLIAAKKKGSYFVRNPNADNVQPVVIAPRTLTRSNRGQWVANLKKSKDRSKNGIGDVALFASIAGTRQAPLSYIASAVNPVGTNMLIHSQGMISAITENVNFTTAFSDAYRPATIDLNSPVESMGIIGMGIDKKGISHYTVRLLPSQAQAKFRQAVINLIPKNISSSQKTIVLKEFTKIIDAWDRLVCGQGSENQISLEEYNRIKNQIVGKLENDGLISLKKLDIEGKSVQLYLNETLKEAAQDIFNPIKLARARAELKTILET